MEADFLCMQESYTMFKKIHFSALRWSFSVFSRDLLNTPINLKAKCNAETFFRKPPSGFLTDSRKHCSVLISHDRLLHTEDLWPVTQLYTLLHLKIFVSHSNFVDIFYLSLILLLCYVLLCLLSSLSLFLSVLHCKMNFPYRDNEVFVSNWKKDS